MIAVITSLISFAIFGIIMNFCLFSFLDLEGYKIIKEKTIIKRMLIIFMFVPWVITILIIFIVFMSIFIGIFQGIYEWLTEIW